MTVELFAIRIRRFNVKPRKTLFGSELNVLLKLKSVQLKTMINVDKKESKLKRNARYENVH